MSVTDFVVLQQDEYSILNSKHIIGIHGYMLVYSVSSLPSFEMIHVIREKILNHLVSNPRPFTYLPPYLPPCVPWIASASSSPDQLLANRLRRDRAGHRLGPYSGGGQQK